MPRDLRWGVVATVAEPAPLVLAFVAHHLELGADEIHLYLDDPNDPVAPLLADVPNLRVTRCTGRHWRSLGITRPKRHNNRQSFNATHAQSKSSVQYLLSCDADEFLRPSSKVIEQLSEFPRQFKWMKVFNLERTYVSGAARNTIFDGVFKAHYQGAASTPLRTTALTPNGFTGHAAGKPFVRSAAGMTIGIHTPRYGHIKDRNVPRHYPADQIELVHFDGLTALHWAAKFIRQAALTPDRLHRLPQFRMEQWRHIFNNFEDLSSVSDRYEELNAYSPSEVEQLEESGYIVRDDIDPSEAIRTVFPQLNVDLSPEAFDAALMPKVQEWTAMARRNGVFELAA